jgi:hypothetical protein
MHSEDKEKLKIELKSRLMCIGVGSISIIEETLGKNTETCKKMRGKILDLMNYQIKLFNKQIDSYNTKEQVTLIGIIKENKNENRASQG